MIVAGIGCREGCPAEAIVALVQSIGAVDALAAPAWKRHEPGLLEAARLLGLTLAFVERDALLAVQPLCPTQSKAAAAATGIASVAEAAALASGGVLLRPRFGAGWATCAVAQRPTHPLVGWASAQQTWWAEAHPTEAAVSEEPLAPDSGRTAP